MTGTPLAPKPLCIAHRGGPGDDPKLENTLAAIDLSASLGVAAIEIDVWLIEGELIAFHDRRLGRCIAGSELIHHLPLAELYRRAKNAGITLATLGEIIDCIGGRAQLNIEIKGPNWPRTPFAKLLSNT